MKRFTLFISIILLSAELCFGAAGVQKTLAGDTGALLESFKVPTGEGIEFQSGATLSGAGTFNLSSGTLTLADNQVTWAKVSKTGSSLADLTTRSATDLTSGIVDGARLPTIWVYAGDSITTETAPPAGAGNTWPELLRARWGEAAQGTVVNNAVSGRTAEYILANYATLIGAHKRTNARQRAVLFLAAGTNDVQSGLTGGAASAGSTASITYVYNTLKSIWALARADGFEVAVGSLLPRETVTMTGWMNSVNALIRSDPTLYDYRMDGDKLFSASDIGGAYFSDGVHPTTAGNTLIAAEWGRILFANTTARFGYEIAKATTRDEALNTLAAPQPKPLGGIAFYRRENSGTAFTVPDNAVFATGLDSFGAWWHGSIVKFKDTFGLPYTGDSCRLTGKTGSNLGWAFYLTTAGKLRLMIGNGADFTTHVYDSSVVVSTEQGRAAHWAFFADRSTGFVFFYENGVRLGAPVDISASAAQTTTTTGSLTIGAPADEYLYTVHSVTLYNGALTADECAATYRAGGVPLPQYRVGSQVNLLSNLARNSTFTDTGTDWGGNSANISLDTTNDRIGVTATSTTGGLRLGMTNLTAGPIANHSRYLEMYSRWRIGFDVITAASPWRMGDQGPSSLYTTRLGAYSGEYQVRAYTGSNNIDGPQQQTTSVQNVYTNLRIHRIGALAHYDFREGANYISVDRTGNGMHGLISPDTDAIVNWVVPMRSGQMIVTQSSAGAGAALMGQVVWDAVNRYRINSWTVYSASGSVLIDQIGTTPAGAQYSTGGITATTTPKDVTLVNRFNVSQSITVNQASATKTTHLIDWQRVD
jgi:lysophospholipase L1-like esterase